MFLLKIVLSIGFKLENATQFINCDNTSKDNFLNIVDFVEKNLNVPRKIYLYGEDVSHKFDKVENIYALTAGNKPNYPTSNMFFYSIFALVILGTWAILFHLIYLG